MELNTRGKPIRIIETGEVFANVDQCAARVGGTRAGIYRCLRGERKTHAGFSYERLMKEPDPEPEPEEEMSTLMITLAVASGTAALGYAIYRDIIVRAQRRKKRKAREWQSISTPTSSKR